MRPYNNVFVELLKPIDRRAFKEIAKRHAGDAYDKSFKSWDHLVALVFGQLSGASSLRELVTAFNAGGGAHYHLGTRRLARSTLAEANARRPAAVFADLFARLTGELDRITRREGAEMLRLIDSTPIPLSKFHAFARSNGRIHGLKMHVDQSWRLSRLCGGGGGVVGKPWRQAAPGRRRGSYRLQRRDRLGIGAHQHGAFRAAADVAAG